LYRDGQPDYKRIADLVQLSTGDLRKLARFAKFVVSFDASVPVPVSERRRELADIANLVAEYCDGDVQKVGLWFELQNPMLGNISPRSMIRYGRQKKLLNFVLAAREAENVRLGLSGAPGTAREN